ncbi:MAG: nucleotide sugar dehydrogenase [Candidatus Bathyarchaeia archaeon]
MSNLMGMVPEEIKSAIASGSLRIAVVGLGWMGLPTACILADRGAKVIGIDSDEGVVRAISNGEPVIHEPGLEQLLEKLIKSGRFEATSDITAAAAESDAFIIIVPTGVGRDGGADYRAIERASKGIAEGMEAGSLVILESTCGPGVTESVVGGTIEKASGLKAGRDYGLAHSPIRAMAGRALQDLQTYPRVVGGIDIKSLEAAAAIKEVMTKGGVIKVRDIRTAEATKLFEAVYRDVNIALANELAILSERLGIDYMEAMKAANTQPYSHLHVPGAGVGGHCLPVYPYLLASSASEHGVSLRLIMESRHLNEDMPRHVVRLCADALKVGGRPLRRAKICILGVSFRANVKEARLSPSLELAKILSRRGAIVKAYDPYFSRAELSKMGLNSEPTLLQTVSGAHCAIITVPHDEFKALDLRGLASSMAKSPCLVDCAHIIDPAEAERAGFVYRGVGRGIWSK